MIKRTQPYERRCADRRQINIGPPPNVEERRCRPVLSQNDPKACYLLPDGTFQRRRQERRKGERRQIDLGPPPGIGERRFQPDPRGVVFLYVDEDIE